MYTKFSKKLKFLTPDAHTYVLIEWPQKRFIKDASQGPKYASDYADLEKTNNK